jgi:hypothetical protein
MGHQGFPGFLSILYSDVIRARWPDPWAGRGSRPPRVRQNGRLMSLPIDQVIRQRKFLAAHPEWSISSQGRGSRFTAECGDFTADCRDSRVVVGMSLRELLDKLETIVDEQA